MPRNSAWQAPLCQGKQARRGRGATRFVERLSRHCCRRLRYSLSASDRSWAVSLCRRFQDRPVWAAAPLWHKRPGLCISPFAGSSTARWACRCPCSPFRISLCRVALHQSAIWARRRPALRVPQCQTSRALPTRQCDTNQAPVLRHSAPPSHPTAPQQSTVRRRARRRNPRNDGSTHGFSLGEDRDE